MAAYTVEQIENALKAKAGNIAAAADALGASRSTIYRHIQNSPTLAQSLVDYRESLVDIAESALRKGVIDGNMTAIIFTLKTQGKSRGYVERQEITGAGGGKIDVVVQYDDYNPKTS